jgi:Tfp pilus assembly protein PilX
MENERGFILLLTFIFMIVLTVTVVTLLFMVTSETRDIGAQIDDYCLLNLAEAGVQRALREIRDDYLTTTQIGIADLRGADTTGSSAVTNVASIRYIREPSGVATFTTGTAMLRGFDANYTRTRIISVFLFARASCSAGPATLNVSYTTDNGLNWTTAFTQLLTTTLTNYSADITGNLTWPVIMDSVNFRLRAQRSSGTGTINLDALWLRVTYEIDTNTEAWAQEVMLSFP